MTPRKPCAENFALITVARDERDPEKVLSMSWWLSKFAQNYLSDQTHHRVNSRALEMIESWRQ